ncbi:MAG TPA: hypothetical protein DCL63_00005 [Firmicutes bacterium]|nr:hypothetical protein [Bacillota bacterium]
MCAFSHCFTLSRNLRMAFLPGMRTTANLPFRSLPHTWVNPRRSNAFYHGVQFTSPDKPGPNAHPSAEVGLEAFVQVSGVEPC